MNRISLSSITVMLMVLLHVSTLFLVSSVEVHPVPSRVFALDHLQSSLTAVMQPWATLFSRVGSHRRCSPTLFVSPRAISNMAYLSTATAGNMWPLLPTVFYHMGTLASETLHFQISPLQSSLLLFCNLRLSAASPCGSYCLLHVLLLLVNTLVRVINSPIVIMCTPNRCCRCDLETHL